MKLLITGSSSMVGQALLRNESLREKYDLIQCDHYEYDLTSKEATRSLFRKHKPNYVIHLASLNGNIAFNDENPASIFLDTTEIAMNVLRTACEFGVSKVVSAISSCAYPSIPLLRESDFFFGEPHGSIESHGFAKRYIIELSRQLYRQYGFMSVGMCFNTAYGPHDSFDLKKTKVMGSLIKRFVEARRADSNEVILWGSGSPRREFIYVDDVARMFDLVLHKYNDPLYPINVGSKTDISISHLSTLVAGIVGYKGRIVFDMSKPDGQMKKLLSNEKMQKHFGQQMFTSLEDGIKRTVDWYESNYNNS
jgi:GDP-L-fucose synthase